MAGVGAGSGSAVAETPCIGRGGGSCGARVGGRARVDQVHKARIDLVGVRHKKGVARQRRTAASPTAPGGAEHEVARPGQDKPGVGAVVECAADWKPVAVKCGHHYGAHNAGKLQGISKKARRRGSVGKAQGAAGRAWCGGCGYRDQLIGYRCARRVGDGAHQHGNRSLRVDQKSARDQEQGVQVLHDAKVKPLRGALENLLHLALCTA